MRARFGLAAIGVSALICLGCAGLRERILSPGVTPTRRERASQAIHEFEERRDTAQLAAAMDRFNQGDTERAEAMLAAIVSRRPDYIEARLHLAEVLWAQEDPSAEQHLRAILQSQPNHAEAHHALGLVLSATNRTAEALQHFSVAAEQDPENEVYQTSERSLIGS